MHNCPPPPPRSRAALHATFRADTMNFEKDTMKIECVPFKVRAPFLVTSAGAWKASCGREPQHRLSIATDLDPQRF